jgi:ketosteroid isomerase-like protein
MTSTNEDIARESYESFNRGERPIAFEMLDEQFELHDHSVPDMPVHHGPDAILANLAQMRESFDDLRYEVERIIGLDDRVLALVQASGRGKLSGITIGGAAGHLWTFREDSIVREDVFPSWDEALEFVRLAE